MMFGVVLTAVLLSTVADEAQVCASVALCNIAAASHTQKVPPRSLISAAASPASQVPQPRKGSDEEEARTPLEAVEESANPKQGKSRECGTIANVEDNNKGRDWLRSTGILREIIARGLVRATGGVIGNLLKAMNNLMCSETTRTELVNSHQMAHLFELIHGYTPEVGLKARTLPVSLPASQLRNATKPSLTCPVCPVGGDAWCPV